MSARQRRPEVMDDPGLDPALHRAALRGLARLNAWSRADAPIWHAIEPVLRTRPLSLLDIATGSADVPIRLARRARDAGYDLSVAGCDLSPVALDAAGRRAHDDGIDAEFFERDVIRDGIPYDHDIITCSLFLHHLSTEDAERLMRAMASAARTFVVITDLRRTRAGTALAALASRLLTRSPVVHTDAVISARAALTIEELRRTAQTAGMTNASIRPIWPSRMRLLWSPPS